MSLKADCKGKIEPEYLEGEPGPLKEEPIFKEPLSVKEEPLFLEEPLKEEPFLKEEPNWDLSACADWYTEQDIKSDVVVGPIVLQPPDAAFATPVLEKSCEQLAPTKSVTSKPVAQAHRCYICQRTFVDDSLLINHVCIPQDVLEARTIPDMVSERSCKTDQGNKCRDMPNFIPNYSVGERIYCDICHKQFKNKSRLKLHRSHHFEELSCKICKVKFKYQNDLDAHHKYHVGFDNNDTNVEDTHIKKEPNYCEICKKYFPSKKYLLKHEEIHTGEIFPCHICKKRFMAERLLLLHKRIHIGEETFICDICQKVFMRKYKLSAHIKYHLSKSIKRFSCDICEKEFLERKSLSAHKKTVHAPEKRYSCKICEIRFQLKRDFLDHVVYVHEGKRFKCETCQEAFPFLHNLRIHELIHGEKKSQTNVRYYKRLE